MWAPECQNFLCLCISGPGTVPGSELSVTRGHVSLRFLNKRYQGLSVQQGVGNYDLDVPKIFLSIKFNLNRVVCYQIKYNVFIYRIN